MGRESSRVWPVRSIINAINNVLAWRIIYYLFERNLHKFEIKGQQHVMYYYIKIYRLLLLSHPCHFSPPCLSLYLFCGRQFYHSGAQPSLECAQASGRFLISAGLSPSSPRSDSRRCGLRWKYVENKYRAIKRNQSHKRHFSFLLINFPSWQPAALPHISDANARRDSMPGSS